MTITTSSISVKRLCLKILFLFICLFISVSAFSRSNWNRDFTTVTYDLTKNTIAFTFEVFDYLFGPARENGYLRWCDVYFSTDCECYKHLMRVETDDQGFQDWTWLKMRYKRIETQLQLLGCFNPQSGVMWPDNNQDVDVDVKNAVIKRFTRNGELYYYYGLAYFTVKWYLGKTYKDVKRIRLNGFWKVNGIYSGDDINNVYYDIPSQTMLNTNKLEESASALKSEINATVSKDAAMKVSKEADAIVISGAKFGDHIKVYTVSGNQFKSIVTNEDIVNIKLTKNQIYIVNIGQAHYKVAL